MYGFVRNNGVNKWDLLGLEADAPENPNRCCDEKTINEGEKELNKRYKGIEKDFQDEDRPRFGARKSPDSCIMINSEVRERLASNPDAQDRTESGIPTCWTCVLENGVTRAEWRGIRGGGFKRFDHWVVVCKAKDTDGKIVKEITFDYWNDHPTPGETPDNFRKNFPRPGEPDITTPMLHQTCNPGQPLIR